MATPYFVQDLITQAYYASSLVSRDFETVSGPQLAEGLLLLNEILADKTIEKDMLPYFTNYTFTAVPNQEKYFIAGLEEIDTLVFYLNNIRYFMKSIPRIAYFGDSRANNISSLPFNYHLERQYGGANLYLYFFPNIAYPMELWGLFRLTQLSFNQDLTAPNTTANLGVPIINTAGTLGVGELVINNIDLAGTYPTVPSFLNKINTGLITNVTASTFGNDVILTGAVNQTINIVTAGTQSPTNNITFSNFSTINGPNNTNFTSLSLDIFYVNYLKYSLADRICKNYNFAVPPGISQQLLKYDLWISNRSAVLDLSMKKVSTLSTDRSLDYGQVNLGLGWTTS